VEVDERSIDQDLQPIEEVELIDAIVLTKQFECVKSRALEDRQSPQEFCFASLQGSDALAEGHGQALFGAADQPKTRFELCRDLIQGQNADASRCQLDRQGESFESLNDPIDQLEIRGIGREVGPKEPGTIQEEDHRIGEFAATHRREQRNAVSELAIQPLSVLRTD